MMSGIRKLVRNQEITLVGIQRLDLLRNSLRGLAALRAAPGCTDMVVESIKSDQSSISLSEKKKSIQIVQAQRICAIVGLLELSMRLIKCTQIHTSYLQSACSPSMKKI